MTISSRRVLAASLAAVAAVALAPAAFAQTADVTEEADEGVTSGPITFSANAAVTTDYRFRGISFSGGDVAVQGGLDLTHESGFYVGTWASTIDDGDTGAYGDVELDLYGGWTGDIAPGLSVDVGLTYYTYPTEDLGLDTDYFEGYTKLAYSLGPVEATTGVYYAWDQAALADDSLYLSTDVSAGLPSTPVTLNAHLGYADGALSAGSLLGLDDTSGLDWSIGAAATYSVFELSVAYVGVEGPSVDGLTDDTIVATLSASF